MRQFLQLLAIVAIVAMGCSKGGVTPDKTNVGPPPTDTTHNTKKDTVRIIFNTDSTQMSVKDYVITGLGFEFLTWPETFFPIGYSRNIRLGHFEIMFVGDSATHLLGHRLEILLSGGAYNRFLGPPSHNMGFTPYDFVFEVMTKEVTINSVASP